MMRIVFAFAACLALVSALGVTDEEAQAQFTAWTAKHSKSYTHDEFTTKFATFKKNLEFILNHDEDAKGYSVDLNEFADVGDEEFDMLYKGYLQVDATDRPASQYRSTHVVDESVDAPESINWLNKGAVTPVKNQGQCGSCWSFSATGSMEGQHLISGQGSLIGLSEKNLMDCSTRFGNHGCDGGLMDYAFEYVISNSGIDSEKSYPYKPQDGSCHYKKSDKAASINAYKDIPQGDEKALTNAIGTVGPVSVAIDASHSSFRFYTSGVYNEPQCSSTRLDHGVLAVGYDATANGDKYYIVKNSWGTGWGNQGYIWMSRDKNNQCGIATASSYPVINN